MYNENNTKKTPKQPQEKKIFSSSFFFRFVFFPGPAYCAAFVFLSPFKQQIIQGQLPCKQKASGTITTSQKKAKTINQFPTTEKQPKKP